jgi:hypothetical protein
MAKRKHRRYGRGNLSRVEVSKLKTRLKKSVNDSPALFEACWREVLKFANQGDISDYQHLKDLYNSIASYKVNNQRSKFYMYG